MSMNFDLNSILSGLSPYLLIDAAIVAVIVVSVVLGAKKGFVLSLAGLLALVVAFFGATFLTNALAPTVGDFLEPKIGQVIEEHLEEFIQNSDLFSPESDGSISEFINNLPISGILDALADLGLYQGQLDSLGTAIQENLSGAATSAAEATAAAIADAVAYRLLFVVLFIVVLIAWNLLARALDLVSKLPVLDDLNKLGGGALGLAKCLILLFLAAWALNLLGGVIPKEIVEQTYLLRFFMTTNPMSLLSGI